MGFISEIKAFMEMEPREQDLVLQALSSLRAGGAWPLFPIKMKIDKESTPKDISITYLSACGVQCPKELQANVNWPKLYDTLCHKRLIIPVVEDADK